jgi:formylglycine-generating enzyme required for sulfatase activity
MKKCCFGFTLLVCLIAIEPADAQIKEPEMILVEGGSFQMGRNDSLDNEKPAHTVKLKPFYIGKYEVTQKLWQAVMDTNPSGFKGCEDCPVEELNLTSIQAFLSKLNKMTGKNYRLPTEAEWEYAAMGGNKSKGYIYSGSNDLSEVAWYKGNADSKTHPVGQKKPNELGIYDMAGNVWELCSDWYDPKYYRRSPSDNPQNTRKAAYKVSRGGSWRSGPERCYSKARNRDIKDHHISNGGIRLVLDKQ